MKKVLLAVVTAGLLLTASNVLADPVKIGVIDLQQVMQKSKQIAAVNEQLTKEFQPRQQKIVELQKSLQTDTDRTKLQDQITSDRANVQGLMMSFQRDVNQAQNDALKKFMTQLNGVISNVAKAGNFDLILQRAGVPYVKTDLDVTSQVLDQLNK